MSRMHIVTLLKQLDARRYLAHDKSTISSEIIDTVILKMPYKVI